MRRLLTSLALASTLSFLETGCSPKLNLPTKNPAHILYTNTPYETTGFNGTRLIVLPKENGTWEFYRDTNKDGIAETYGQGIDDPLGGGLFRVYAEQELAASDRFHIESISNYFKGRLVVREIGRKDALKYVVR